MASAGRPTDGRSYSCNGWWGPRTEPTNYRPEGEWPGTSRPAGSGSERTKLRRLQRRETKAWENQPIGQRKWQPLRERSMDCVHSRIYDWIVALRQAEHALRQVTNTLHILTTGMQMKWPPQTSRVWRMPAHRQELNSIAVEPTIAAKLDRNPPAPLGLERVRQGKSDHTVANVDVGNRRTTTDMSPPGRSLSRDNTADDSSNGTLPGEILSRHRLCCHAIVLPLTACPRMPRRVAMQLCCRSHRLYAPTLHSHCSVHPYPTVMCHLTRWQETTTTTFHCHTR